MKLKLNFCAHEIYIVKTNRTTDKKKTLRLSCTLCDCKMCVLQFEIAHWSGEERTSRKSNWKNLNSRHEFLVFLLGSGVGIFFLITFFFSFLSSICATRSFVCFSIFTQHTLRLTFFCTNNKAVNCQKKLPYTERQLHADSQTCVGKMCAAVV